ncbi:MAG TPA: ABC transporter ATP-binding protein [Virgibacillus sp.]|nr:ABC transporter ATP-binding protein [Virgibacillus sp.]
MIEVKNVTQSFQKRIILEQVNLHVEKNERIALVGRNGAGKSTLIHTVLGILPLKKGTITLAGHSIKDQEWKKNVAYLPEKFHLYPHLTGLENILFFAALDHKRVDEQEVESKLRMVSLWDDRNQQISSYSKGMLQRLGLAVMLYYDSDIIFLDEPTSGLDPIGRTEILQIIHELTNKTIVMASHHLEEVKQVCTHVAFLDGRKLTKYTVEEFLSVFEGGEWA